MPQIIVTAGPGEDLEQTTVMLRERVNAADFESDRFGANLLERLGWAVEDAEGREFASGDDAPALVAPHATRNWNPEPIRVS